MNAHPNQLFEEDVQLVKSYTLMPILLEMLARDIEELKTYKEKIIYHHLIYYLRDMETVVLSEVHGIKRRMKARDLKVLTTEMKTRGIYVKYKVRGYVHEYVMLRNLVKAELMTALMKMRGSVR